VSRTLISHAQNREDVVLWRALGDVENGSYVEIGANDPDVESITRAFYDRGWRGMLIEPIPELAERLRQRRPDDTVVEAAVTDSDAAHVTLHAIAGTGLSSLSDEVGAAHRTHGWDVRDIEVRAARLDDLLEEHGWGSRTIHFMTVDVEGTEREVLASVDLRRWRPWVLVIESTFPLSTAENHSGWEDRVLEAGYRFCLFDGLSRFYVAEEHADGLAPRLGYAACIFDDYVPFAQHEAQVRADRLQHEAAEQKALAEELADQLVRWRGQVLDRWVEACVGGGSGTPSPAAEHLRRELEAMRATLSWRVTKPLRSVRSATRGAS
jgi:FkbM family methyltransferase